MMLIYTLIGSLLPLWGGAILIRGLGQWQGWSFFWQHGELAIYSATLLAPTVYLITRDYKMIGKRILLLITVVFLITATLLFAGVKSCELYERTVDLRFLTHATIYVFLISIVISYLANVFEYARLDADIQKARREDLNTLEEDFNRLRG